MLKTQYDGRRHFENYVFNSSAHSSVCFMILGPRNAIVISFWTFHLVLNFNSNMAAATISKIAFQMFGPQGRVTYCLCRIWGEEVISNVILMIKRILVLIFKIKMGAFGKMVV